MPLQCDKRFSQRLNPKEGSPISLGANALLAGWVAFLKYEEIINLMKRMVSRMMPRWGEKLPYGVPCDNVKNIATD